MITPLSPAHFGRKILITYLLSFGCAVLASIPLFLMTRDDELLTSLISLLIGGFIACFSHYYLHLPLFAKPTNYDIGVIACGLIVATNLLDLGPLPVFSWSRLGSALLVGLAAGVSEELLVRGPLLWWLLARHPRCINAYWWASVVSALIFGALHLSNLSVQPDLGQTLIQVGYTITMGFAAAAIIFTTHNLWFTIAMHALFDAVAGYIDPALVSQISFDAWDLISLFIMMVVEIAIGVYLLRHHTATSRQSLEPKSV